MSEDIQGKQPFMKIKIIAINVCMAALAACGTTPPPKVSYDAADASLAEASYSVSRSIVSLSETAQATRPIPNLAPQPDPRTYGMAILTSIDWSGPVGPLVEQVAKAANYHVRILGRPPAVPVLVSLYDKNRMVADVLRDIGYQCGRRAAIVVYPENRVVELRYAQN